MALECVPVVAPALSDIEAASELADFHREIASRMEVGSDRRALVLRCGVHWNGIAGASASPSLRVAREES
jgi:hypothetical protein